MGDKVNELHLQEALASLLDGMNQPESKLSIDELEVRVRRVLDLIRLNNNVSDETWNSIKGDHRNTLLFGFAAKCFDGVFVEKTLANLRK